MFCTFFLTHKMLKSGNGFNITDLSQTKEPEAPERRDPSQLELLFVEINDWLHLIVTFLYLG